MVKYERCNECCKWNFARDFTFLEVKDFDEIIVSKFANQGHAWQSQNLCGDFILDSNVNKCP